MKYRKLRIAFSAACLIACVLLVVLWVRSYQSADVFSGGVFDVQGKVESAYGVLCFKLLREDGYWRHTSFEVVSEYFEEILRNKRFLLRWNSEYGGVMFLPHWFIALIFATFAAAPWIRWSKRFTLRTLLLAITLVAILLGTVISLSR